jgi:hypothetical protein
LVQGFLGGGFRPDPSVLLDQLKATLDERLLADPRPATDS